MYTPRLRRGEFDEKEKIFKLPSGSGFGITGYGYKRTVKLNFIKSFHFVQLGKKRKNKLRLKLFTLFKKRLKKIKKKIRKYGGREDSKMRLVARFRNFFLKRLNRSSIKFWRYDMFMEEDDNEIINRYHRPIARTVNKKIFKRLLHLKKCIRFVRAYVKKSTIRVKNFVLIRNISEDFVSNNFVVSYRLRYLIFNRLSIAGTYKRVRNRFYKVVGRMRRRKYLKKAKKRWLKFVAKHNYLNRLRKRRYTFLYKLRRKTRQYRIYFIKDKEQRRLYKINFNKAIIKLSRYKKLRRNWRLRLLFDPFSRPRRVWLPLPQHLKRLRRLSLNFIHDFAKRELVIPTFKKKYKKFVGKLMLSFEKGTKNFIRRNKKKSYLESFFEQVIIDLETKKPVVVVEVPNLDLATQETFSNLLKLVNFFFKNASKKRKKFLRHLLHSYFINNPQLVKNLKQLVFSLRNDRVTLVRQPSISLVTGYSTQFYYRSFEVQHPLIKMFYEKSLRKFKRGQVRVFGLNIIAPYYHQFIHPSTLKMVGSSGVFRTLLFGQPLRKFQLLPKHKLLSVKEIEEMKEIIEIRKAKKSNLITYLRDQNFGSFSFRANYEFMTPMVFFGFYQKVLVSNIPPFYLKQYVNIQPADKFKNIAQFRDPMVLIQRKVIINFRDENVFVVIMNPKTGRTLFSKSVGLVGFHTYKERRNRWGIIKRLRFSIKRFLIREDKMQKRGRLYHLVFRFNAYDLGCSWVLPIAKEFTKIFMKVRLLKWINKFKNDYKLKLLESAVEMAQNPFLDSNAVYVSTDFSNFITNTLFVRFQLLKYRLFKTMTLSPFTRDKEEAKTTISWSRLLRRIIKSRVVKKRLLFLFTRLLRKRFYKIVKSSAVRAKSKFQHKILVAFKKKIKKRVWKVIRKTKKRYYYITRRRVSMKHRWVRRIKKRFKSNRAEFLKFLLFWPDTFRLLVNRIMLYNVIGLAKSSKLFILKRFFRNKKTFDYWYGYRQVFKVLDLKNKPNKRFTFKENKKYRNFNVYVQTLKCDFIHPHSGLLPTKQKRRL